MAKYMDRRIESDSEFEGRIRPQELEQFSGQEKIVENLRVFIKAALMRGDSLDHTLLHGPPGLGKTTHHNDLRSSVVNVTTIAHTPATAPISHEPASFVLILNIL